MPRLGKDINDSMDIVRTPQGLYKTNCYIVKDKGQALIIDPGFHGKQIMKEMGDAEPVGIMITHGHADHICAVDTIVNVYDIPIYMHPKDDELLRVKRRMPSAYKERFVTPYLPLREGYLSVGSFELMIWETPGHSAGSVCIAYKKALFTGDTLFNGTIGRVKTFNGNTEDMQRTLKKLVELDSSYIIYPGHGPSSSLGIERITNPFLKDV